MKLNSLLIPASIASLLLASTSSTIADDYSDAINAAADAVSEIAPTGVSETFDVAVDLATELYETNQAAANGEIDYTEAEANVAGLNLLSSDYWDAFYDYYSFWD